MTPHRRMLPAGLLAVLALAGCTATNPPVPTATTAGATVVPSPVPTVTPAQPSASATAAGCASGGPARPADATPVVDGDLDGDGRDDAVYYSASSSEFGIATASGADLPVRDPLAGPGRHTGWATRIAGGAAVMVLADGRGARLYSLQRSGTTCSVAPVKNSRGVQYEFDQEELRGTGTGVGCRRQGGALQLGGYDAHAVASGRFRVTFTRVTVSPDGRTAVNGATSVLDASAASTSALVHVANGSSCGPAPIVGSSGQ